MRTITVTGHGTARVVPDAARVSVTIVHRAAGLAETIAGCDSGVRAAGEVARRFTDPSRIGSRTLHVGPAYDREDRAAGFEARHSLGIGCPDLDTAGELLVALAEQVGDRLQVDRVTLEVTDRSAAEGAAREAAYADARARAEHLAALAGATLGEVQSVLEGGVAHRVLDGVPLAAYASRVEMSFEPGETGIDATLTVTFQLV